MDVFDAIRERRSHRAFAQKSVEPEKLDSILEAAQWAPSPVNSQPWEFIIITGKAARSRVAALSEEAKTGGSVEIHGYSFIRPTPYISETEAGAESISQDQESIDAHGYSLDFLESVPAMIAVVGNPVSNKRQIQVDRSEDGYKYACAAAIQNMLLAAQALGLGSLWFTFFDRDALSRFLGVPPEKHLIAVVCLGYPDATPPSPGRKPLGTIVRRID